jgi:NADH-quinone oxidoreductase subunit C
MSKTETIEKIKGQFPDKVLDSHSFRDDETFLVKKESVYEIMKYLRDDPDMIFNFMMDLTAVDYMGKDPRFEVVYHLYSLRHNKRVRIKAPVTESDPTIDSIVSLWVAADWYEREVYDMYGIRFNNHPNLKRILLYEEFEGHPLRKDYPLKKRQPLIGPNN